MDVICLDDDAEMSEACTVQVLSDDESDDLLPDYPVPSVRQVAHGQSVNAPRENVVAPDVSATKGKKKLSSSDRDQLEAKRMEKRAQQAAERAHKRMHKEMEKRLKQAEKDARREEMSGERQKHVLVLLDRCLSDNKLFMQELLAKMAQYDIQHRSVSHLTPATIRWTRVISQRTVDANAQLLIHKEEKDEKFVLARLEAVEFAALILGDIAARKGELVATYTTLSGYIADLHRVYPLCKIILVVIGMDIYYRNIKTKKNRRFREQVRSQASSSGQDQGVSSSDEQVVSKEDVQEALVGMQLQMACVVRLVENEGDFADLIVCYTRAIADAPFKKDDLFSFHAESRSTRLPKSAGAEDVALTWKHMLMQFNHVSMIIADAIVSEYPSPSSLLKAYSKCDGTKDAELLLQDIVIRRGVGVTASSRRIGPVLSRRIHTYLTCTNGETMLH